MLPTKRTRSPSGVRARAGWKRRKAKNCSKGGRPLIARTLPAVDSATMHATLPWAWYVEPEILRREQERIFRSTWAYVGHTGQLERDGDWITATIGLTPLV